MKEKGYLQKVLSVLISVGLAISGWFLTQAYGEIKEINSRVAKVEIVQAEASGNRFTSNDWMREKSILDQRELEKEKRFSTLEADLRVVKETVLEIKDTLKGR